MLQPSRAEAVEQAGLYADPVAIEQSVWRKFSPWRNRWPEVLEFDVRVAELEAQQQAKAEELRQLRDRERVAPDADAERLATWLTDGERGPRPEPELPRIREQIQQRQEEWVALSRATEKVLAEKTAYVEKHRKRLLGEAASQAREVQARYHAAIDLMAEARDELRAARQAELWAALCPDQLAGQTAPDSLCGGRKQPLQKLGLTSGTVQANLVIEALHDDADWQRGTATHEQYAALHDKHPVAVRPGKAEWANDPAVKAARDKQTAEWLSKR